MVYLMTVCVIYYHLGLGHPQREAMTQTHRQMDMATYRLNQPRGQFRGKSQTIPHMMDGSLALQHRHGLRPASVNIFIFQIPQKVLRICQLSVCCVSVCCVQGDWLSHLHKHKQHQGTSHMHKQHQGTHSLTT